MPELPNFFAELALLGIQVAFATNNATRTPSQYVAKFKRFGVAIKPKQIMTSALVTAAFLGQTVKKPGPIYIVGRDGLIEAVEQQGFEVLPRFDISRPAAAVAVGFNQEVTYDDFAAAAHHIRYYNARFVGCNPDTTFPTERGLVPGNGSLIALIQAATDQTPEIIGKPYPPMFEACLAGFGPQANQQNTAMVGDRLNTDILGGQNAGLKTILVLSGVTSKSELAESSIRPDYIFQDIQELLNQLK